MMCGIAMFTIVPSSTTMSWAAVMTVRAMPRCRLAVGATSGSGVETDCDGSTVEDWWIFWWMGSWRGRRGPTWRQVTSR